MVNSVQTKQFDLPMSMELEIRCIGALLNIGDPKKHTIQKAMIDLSDDYFYSPNTRDIYRVIRKQFDNNLQFDAVSISSLVETNRFEFFQHTLRDEYFTSNLLAHDIEQLNNYRILRKQLVILQSALSNAINESIPNIALGIIAENLTALTKTVSNTSSDNKESVINMVDEWFSKTESDSYIYLPDSEFPPVPTQSLITIAGRSGHGKSFLSMYLGDLLINQLPDKQNIYFNLEMNKHIMLTRYAGMLGYTGDSERDLVKNALPELIKKNIYFVNLPMITIEQIETICRTSALKQPLGVVTVDYLQLVKLKNKSESHNLDQSEITKRLAALSIELNCIVIDLIQVNRDFKTRPIGQRVPQVSDSADSMGSVNSATWWLGIDQPQKDGNDLQFKDLFQIACRKNRNGENFYIDLEFKNGRFSKRMRSFYETNPISHGLDMRKTEF